MIRSVIKVRKYLTTVTSFIIMLCLGSVYAWSIIASELIEKYDFSASQTQLIFGVLIAIFPVTMILTGSISKKIKHSYFGLISGFLFLSGFWLASYSKGNFLLVFAGIGILSGIATGLGYWVSLTAPVQFFPERKGLVTGIAAAGFGLGAVFMSQVSELLLKSGYSVLELLRIVGLIYGMIIVVTSNFHLPNSKCFGQPR
jgi:MFS transporter, OFA family, oxalate/formate antiporter